MTVRLVLGDCLDVLPQLRRDRVLVDAVVTDAPYHLVSIVERLGKPGSAPIQSGATGVYARSSTGFMGQEWDGGDVAFRPETWAAVADVMKPGALLVAFGAPRGVHRMASAIEDAGFEIRDRLLNLVAADEHAGRFLASLTADQLEAFAMAIEQSEFGGELAWIFGTGFPKSHNLKGEDEGKGTALKPAYEPIIIARKPSPLPVPESVARYGVGAINIDAGRIHAEDKATGGGTTGVMKLGGANPRPCHQESREKTPRRSVPGRWPANVSHDSSDDVLQAFAAYGDRGALAPVRQRNGDGFRGTYGALAASTDEEASTFQGDSGTAARFFYSAKAKDSERVFRCRQCGDHQLGKPRCGHRDAQGALDLQTHPTVKPVELMRWLVRLVCPPGGLVLDPFAGTGTTGAAAAAEGCNALLIERARDYAADICVRLGLPLEELESARVSPIASSLDGHGPLFGTVQEAAE